MWWVIAVQLCKYTENPWILYLKQVEFMLHKLYFNEALRNKEEKLRNSLPPYLTSTSMSFSPGSLHLPS
jgi:hypothetical protein